MTFRGDGGGRSLECFTPRQTAPCSIKYVQRRSALFRNATFSKFETASWTTFVRCVETCHRNINEAMAYSRCGFTHVIVHKKLKKNNILICIERCRCITNQTASIHWLVSYYFRARSAHKHLHQWDTSRGYHGDTMLCGRWWRNYALYLR